MVDVDAIIMIANIESIIFFTVALLCRGQPRPVGDQMTKIAEAENVFRPVKTSPVRSIDFKQNCLKVDKHRQDRSFLRFKDSFQDCANSLEIRRFCLLPTGLT